MDGLIEGCIVHYVLENGPSVGEHRPAIIVKVWETHREQGTVNLQVFTDGTNDVDPRDPQTNSYAKGMTWATSVPYSEEPRPRTWHWIERV